MTPNRRRRLFLACLVAATLVAGLWLALPGAKAPTAAPTPPPELTVRRSTIRPETRAHRPARPQTEARDRTAAPPDAPADAPPADDPRTGLLVVDVVDEDGRPAEDATLVPIDCPGFGGGPPGEFTLPVGSCVLRAMRRDGALLARGPAASVEVTGGDPAYLQLELPNHRTGGIGIRFVPGEGGMRVMNVVPGSPAFAAGLEVGDVITAIGGEPVANMDSEQFVERMTGAEGTEVEFTLGIETDTGVAVQTLRVTRAFLEI